jgi:hypothetical protein
MLFVPPFAVDEELCAGDGFWSRSQFLTMDEHFVTAVEAAFRAGLESRVAAAATVQAKSSLHDNRRLVEEAAIGAVWEWFAGVKFEATATEVLARVHAVCPSIAAERVREEFWLRLVARQAAGICTRRPRPVSDAA